VYFVFFVVNMAVETSQILNFAEKDV